MGIQQRNKKITRSALLQIAGGDFIERAWKRMLSDSTVKSRNGFGVDGESINDIAHHFDTVKKEIASQMIKRDSYQFRALRPFVIPKKNGKERIICVPTVRDRLVQRAVLEFISEGDKSRLSNAVSYGFIPGRGVRRAAARACELRGQLRFAYKTDISAFFDTIGRDKLIAQVRSAVRQRSLWELLERALNCEIDSADDSLVRKAAGKGIVNGKGVRQGMPLSPFFANIYLKNFDAQVIKKKFAMVRYADDLIFFAATEDECYKIHALVVSELAKLGLSVPELGPNSKTQIYQPTQAAEFLGVELVPMNGGYVLQIAIEQIKKACDKIRDASSQATVFKQGRTLSEIQRNLGAIHAGYLEAYKFTNNLNELDRFLSRARTEQIQKLILQVAGIDITKLSDPARRFIGA